MVLDTAENLTNTLRLRAVQAAALAGWLDGLELRDEIGEPICVIVETIGRRSGKLSLRCSDGGTRKLGDLCVNLTDGDNHLGQSAVIECGQLRVAGLGDVAGVVGASRPSGWLSS